MTSQEVQEALKGKKPITRGSEAHNKTFEIKAIREGDGAQAEITDLLVCERYSPVLYDLKWSTEYNRDIPFVGRACKNRQKALESDASQRSVSVEPTVRMSSEIALEFETVRGDTCYVTKSLKSISEGDLFYELIVNYNFSPTDESIMASYKPTSDRCGELRVHTHNGVIKESNRVFEGEVDRDSYSNEKGLIERHKAWIVYQSKAQDGTEWFECQVINAYENDDGSKVLISVENPLGEKTGFQFNLSEDENSPYWELINSISQGDPANLAGSTVWLRHRYRSFYNLDVSEHQELIGGAKKVLSIDVNNEWELRVSNPNTEVKDNVSEESLGILSRLKSFV